MKFIKITDHKKQYLDLLLLADEEEAMIDKYLAKGDMYGLVDNGVKSICVVVDNGNRVFEIKNIATAPMYQGKGYAKAMLSYVCDLYKNMANEMIVGTGDSPLTIPFYEKCGFVRYGVVKNFFIDNYSHPIIEDGVQLVDMIMLKKELR